MPEGQVLEFSQVTKRFGAVTAVSDLSVRVEPGAVTGFLGPNGAGKTTSLRILLGQIRPTSGTATIGGASYSDLRHPLRTVGAVLEESAYRPRRTASRQLLIAAKANGIPSARVDEVLRLVGLQEDADTRLGSYSLGMRQRLAVACALLGDPGVLVLDEPANGLDPEGIRWMRLLMRRLADEGRTVLVSSHVLSEIEQVADNVVVLSKGRAVHAGPISELADASGGAVVVDAENRAPLITALSAAKLDFDVLRSGVTVRDSDSATVGAVAAAAGVALTMLQQRGPSLEEVFLDLVYGRRSDSPRLDTSANPVAHAPLTAPAIDDAGDVALVAGGVPLAGAAAVVADGGMVAAAGAGYGAAPHDAADASADDGDATPQSDAAEEPDAAAGDDAAETEPEAGASATDADAGADAEIDAMSSDEARAAEQSDDDLVDALADAPSDDTDETAGAEGSDQDAEADAEATDVAEGDNAIADLFGAAAEASDEDRADAPHENAEQQHEGSADGVEPADEHGDDAHSEHGDAEQGDTVQDDTAQGDSEQADTVRGEAVSDNGDDEQGDTAQGEAARDDEHGDAEHSDADLGDADQGDAAQGDTGDKEQDHAAHGDAEQEGDLPADEQRDELAVDARAADGEHHEHDDDHGSEGHDPQNADEQPSSHEDEHGDADPESPEHEGAPDESQSPADHDAEYGDTDEHDAADEESADEHPAADGTDSSADEPSDETRPLILPLATEAVTLPSATVEPTFTELITGIPASVTTEGADGPVTTTEAISIVTPELAHDEDEDAVDDGDDDPRLAAMRTSLSAAASRFFDGPAPDYPYSSRAERREDAAADASSNDEGAAQHDERNDHS
ncbi:ATP-binding cassette domain-containing protein [Microbacterium sp. NPDC089321]|uniref:ATP-binding cassette domain-containing protein n=1 Tax=Microbacterium sp. NPDC089321 TaxID=3155183 RepID=UPI00343D7B49